jgi:hypothetical protein
MPIGPTPITDALEVHSEHCRICTPWSPCEVAARLLTALRELVLPSIPPIRKPETKA